jgi:hypothetical protein
VKSHCITCHAGPQGSNNNVDDFRLTDSRDQVKTPPMRTVYQRMFLDRSPGAQSITGFGLGRDGTGAANFLPTVHAYDLDNLETLTEFANVKAYLLCFDTGTPPSAAYARTVTTANMAQSAVLADLSAMESASLSWSDLVVQGMVGGRPRSYRYSRTSSRYITDKAGETALSRSQLLALLGTNDAITFTGMPFGQGNRRGGDRNRNGVLDSDEPKPAMSLFRPGGSRVGLAWPEAGWALERSPAPVGPWSLVLQPFERSGGTVRLDYDPAGAAMGFFRLRRIW